MQHTFPHTVDAGMILWLTCYAVLSVGNSRTLKSVHRQQGVTGTGDGGFVLSEEEPATSKKFPCY